MQRVSPVPARLDLLLGRIDPRCAAPRLGALDAPRQFPEVGRQVGVGDLVVGKLGAAADDRALGPVEPDRAVARNAHGEHHRRPRTIGQQARRAFAQHRGVKTRLAIGQVERRAAPPRLGVDCVAILDEPADIGDRIMEQQVAPAALDRKRLVEVLRRCRIERDEMFGGAIDMLGRDTLSRRSRRCDYLRWECVWHLILDANGIELGG